MAITNGSVIARYYTGILQTEAHRGSATPRGFVFQVKANDELEAHSCQGLPFMRSPSISTYNMIKPCRTPRATASVRLEASSLLKMEAT